MEKLQKVAKSVTIRTSDNRTISGNVFLLSSERLSDFVNQGPQFIPVDSKNGIEVINKDHIISLLELKPNVSG